MHNSVCMAKITWNFILQSTLLENAKLKCSKNFYTQKSPNQDAAEI